jgi:hypothetical protein
LSGRFLGGIREDRRGASFLSVRPGLKSQRYPRHFVPGYDRTVPAGHFGSDGASPSQTSSPRLLVAEFVFNHSCAEFHPDGLFAFHQEMLVVCALPMKAQRRAHACDEVTSLVWRDKSKEHRVRRPGIPNDRIKSNVQKFQIFGHFYRFRLKALPK